MKRKKLKKIKKSKMIKINLRHHSRAKIKKNQKSILKYASSNKMIKLMSQISSLKRKIRKKKRKIKD